MIKELSLTVKTEQGKEKIPIQVIYSKRKTIGLEVSGEGKVTVRAPEKLGDGILRDFVHSKETWILQKYLLMEKRRAVRMQRGEPDYVKDPSLEKRYRSLARIKIAERVEFFARQMGVTYGRISIRAAKTRWGSCSGKGNLNFHWKLILMPPQVLDYVVVHELAHRKQMNHSPAFWAEVEKVMPDYSRQRAWLKTWGQTV